MCISKCIVPYFCYIFSNFNFLDLLQIFRPWSCIFISIVFHSATAANFHSTTCIECPCYIFATLTRCYFFILIGTRFHRNVIFYGILFCVSIFINMQFNFFHYNILIIYKSTFMNIFDIIRQINICQIPTHFKCILCNCFYTVRQNKLCYIINGQERCRTNVFQLTFFFKCDSICIINICQRKLIEGRNIFSNKNRFNFCFICYPR